MLRRFRTVALALTVVMGAFYVLSTASSATSSGRLGTRLVHRFFNELVRHDAAVLRAFLSPAFQIQRADGSRETKAHYLRHLPDVLSYRVRKLRETTARGVVVVTYRAGVDDRAGQRQTCEVGIRGARLHLRPRCEGVAVGVARQLQPDQVTPPPASRNRSRPR